MYIIHYPPTAKNRTPTPTPKKKCIYTHEHLTLHATPTQASTPAGEADAVRAAMVIS